LKTRVVVTGLGAITPLGNSVKTFWENVCNGISGVDKISRFDTKNFDAKIAAEVKNFDPQDYMDKKEARRMDRYTQFSMAATQMAIKQSELDMNIVNPERMGVILGSGIGGIETLEKQANVLNNKGPRRVSPFFVPMMIANMAAGQISIALGARGINTTIITACASATNAIGEAYRTIRGGYADVIITGGSEAPITPLALAGFCSMRALSTQNTKSACRPFDLNRDGFVMGEGSGIIILESYDHAVKRGAKILAEIIGYGSTADAYHITAPAPEGEGGVGKVHGVGLADALCLLLVYFCGNRYQVRSHSGTEAFNIVLVIAIAVHPVIAELNIIIIAELFCHAVTHGDQPVVELVKLLTVLLVEKPVGLPGFQPSCVVGVLLEGRELGKGVNTALKGYLRRGQELCIFSGKPVFLLQLRHYLWREGLQLNLNIREHEFAVLLLKLRAEFRFELRHRPLLHALLKKRQGLIHEVGLRAVKLVLGVYLVAHIGQRVHGVYF